MKRMVFVVGMVALVGVAFAAGNAAPKLKFPWASEAMNKPCDKTELEWRCLANAIGGGGEPTKLSKEFTVVSLTAEPLTRGLRVKAVVAPRPPFKPDPRAANWWQIIDRNTRYATSIAKSRFGDKGMFEDDRDIHLDFCVGEVLVGSRNFDGFHRADLK